MNFESFKIYTVQMSDDDEFDIVKEILREVLRAEKLHPKWPTDPVHAAAILADTGLEYPEIRDFVKTWENVDWVKPEMPFNQVIKKYGFPVVSKEVSQAVYEYRSKPDGYRAAQFGLKDWGNYCRGRMVEKWKFLLDAPFRVSHKCCYEMKKKPLRRYTKEAGFYCITATMADESFRRQTTWTMYGCNVLTGKNPRSAPMSFWTEQDVLQYIKKMNIPISSVYGEIVEGKDGKLCTTGAKRTGCMFCMFGVHMDKSPNRFQRMYYTHPKQWDYCINRLGLKDVLDYIHVPYLPEEDLFGGEF